MIVSAKEEGVEIQGEGREGQEGYAKAEVKGNQGHGHRDG